MKIISGKTGSPHVTSQQFRQIFEGIIGDESCILPCGENLAPELQTNNSLKIRSGLMYHHGNLSTVELGTYDEVTIQNGTQGMKRTDLVVNRYTREEGSGTEKNEWIVIQGTPHASSPTVPGYTEGNLQDGDLVDDCPYLEVHLDGINVVEIKQLLSVANAMSTINKNLSEYYNDGLDHCIRFPGAHIQICFGTFPITVALDQNGSGYTGTTNPNHKFAKPFSSLASLQIGNADNNWFWIVRKLASAAAIQTVVLGYFAPYPSTTFYVDYMAIGTYSD